MKILFLISSINSSSRGLGGHFHSLLETVAQVERLHDCHIINIGSVPAKAFSKYEGNFKFIPFHAFNIISVYQEIYSYSTFHSIDIIHSFDRLSFFWGRLLSIRTKVASVFTKCGGPNFGYWPYSSNTVLFSLENLNYFQRKFADRTTNFYLIPNRIVPFKTDKKRINELKLHYLDSKFIQYKVLLRICRIGKTYQSSLKSFIKLVNNLNLNSINSVGIIIGTVEDEDVFLSLKEYSKNLTFPSNIIFVLDDLYSRNAKELIDVADLVLGTGRSLMEAAAKAKPVLFPLLNGELALLSPSNFDQAFYYNFSQRVILDDFSSENNFLNIKNVLISSKVYQDFSDFSYNTFTSYFDANKLSILYTDIYMKHKESHEIFSVRDILLHLILLIKVSFVK